MIVLAQLLGCFVGYLVIACLINAGIIYFGEAKGRGSAGIWEQEREDNLRFMIAVFWPLALFIIPMVIVICKAEKYVTAAENKVRYHRDHKKCKLCRAYYDRAALSKDSLCAGCE